MRLVFGFAGDVGDEVDAVDPAICGERSAGGRGGGRVHVEVVYGCFDLGAGRDAGRPLDEVGDVDPAFEERDLPSAERPVDLGETDIPRSAVVRGEEHDGVLVESVAFERAQHLAHATVEAPDHRRVDPLSVALDV